MDLLKLIFKNVFRHRLRTILTILALAMTMTAFCVLRTLVDAWYIGVEASSPNRLVTRNKVSLIYMLPAAYGKRILQVEGVTGIGAGLWYAGVYKDKKNFFPQFAISGLDYLDLYPEFILSDAERKAFARERRACIAGKKVAERFGWKIGDVIPLQGTVFPGNLELVLTGIYRGARPNVDETALFFHLDYINETFKKASPDLADKIGWYIVRIKDPAQAAQVSRDIDHLFENSLAETLTETEKAFQMGFVAMTEAIVVAITVISFAVILIMLLVLANTMAMTARERTSEYAVFKALGFGPWFVHFLISGESMAISLMGGLLGIILCFPGVKILHHGLENFLPIMQVNSSTVVIAALASVVMGFIAGLPPTARIVRMPVADALRHMG
jgi:putative ABC transport system permease protein